MPNRKAAIASSSGDWRSQVKESSHDVVLAGLASLARACSAGTKPAQADFKTLVAEGRRLEPELHEAAQQVWSEWVSRPPGSAARARRGRLQSVFDERVSSALARLGMPSGRELAELRSKVDCLLAHAEIKTRPAVRSREAATARRRAAGAAPVPSQAARRRGPASRRAESKRGAP